MGRPDLPQFDGPDGEEADEGDDPLHEKDGATERETYWSDDDGSSSDEYDSEGEGSEIAIDPDNESETEELENQQVTHRQDPETFVPGETFRPDSPELMPQPQMTVFSVPAVEDTPMSSLLTMIGQQGVALQGS